MTISEDIYLATGELLRTALDAEALTVSASRSCRRRYCGFTAGTFKSAKLRADVTMHAEDCIDLCTLLRSPVDDVVVEDEGGAYRIVLVKRR